MLRTRTIHRHRLQRMLRLTTAAVVTGALVAAPLVAAADDTGPRRGKTSQHAFLSKRAGYHYVAQWAPCRKVGYRVNQNGVHRKIGQVKKAVARVERTSGLNLVYQGRSNIVPGARKARDYPRGTDLVVAWALPKGSNKLPKGAAGHAGFSWRSFKVKNHRYGQIVEGYVLVNKRYHYANGFGSGPQYGLQGTLGQLLMHELGHAVGLAHVRTKSQIMYRTVTGKRATWGAGDAKGLNRLGNRRICRAMNSRWDNGRDDAPIVRHEVAETAVTGGPGRALRHEGWE